MQLDPTWASPIAVVLVFLWGAAWLVHLRRQKLYKDLTESHSAGKKALQEDGIPSAARSFAEALSPVQVGELQEAVKGDTRDTGVRALLSAVLQAAPVPRPHVPMQLHLLQWELATIVGELAKQGLDSAIHQFPVERAFQVVRLLAERQSQLDELHRQQSRLDRLYSWLSRIALIASFLLLLFVPYCIRSVEEYLYYAHMAVVGLTVCVGLMILCLAMMTEHEALKIATDIEKAKNESGGEARGDE